MKGFSDQDYKEIISLLTKIKTLIDQFYEQTCMQTDILSSDDIDSLEKNISERQTVIDEIDKHQTELDKLLKSYESNLMSIDTASEDPKIKEISLIRAQIKQRLYDTQQVSEKNAEMAKANKEKYLTESKRLKMSRKSIKLYNQDIYMNESLIYDKKK